MKKLSKIQIILTVFLFLYSSAVFSSDFGAYYTRLDYEDKISGKYADIVVQFEKDRKFVFCRESGYLPYWQSEKGKWYVDEIVKRTGDGRSAKASDRAAHSSLVWGSPSQDYLMYGFSNEPASTLLPLAGSWNNPPKVKNAIGVICNGYQPQQRAYLMTATSQNLSFGLDGSEKKPIVNPCFVIRNWGQKDAELKINGQEIKRGDSFRYGHRRTAEGIDLIVWIKRKSVKPIEFTVIGLSN